MRLEADDARDSVRRELAQAARAALAATHARERRARLWIRTKRVSAIALLVVSLGALVFAAVASVRGASQPAAGVFGAGGTAVATWVLAAPAVRRRWAVIRRQGSIERALDDSSD